MAKLNIAELELSGHASSLSINCRHIPSLPWYFSSELIISL